MQARATATSAVLGRCAQLRLAITDYVNVERYRAQAPNSTQDTDANLRHANLLELVVNQANQLRKALEQPGVPRSMRRDGLNKDLRERILRLRDMLEHWETNQDDFQRVGAPYPPRKAVHKFAGQHPGKNPWSASRSNLEGFVIGGVINLGELLAAVERIEEIAEQPRPIG